MTYDEIVKIDFELMIVVSGLIIDFFDDTEKILELIDDNVFIELKRR